MVAIPSKYSLLLVAATSLYAFACSTGSLEFELPYEGDKLVLNAILSNTGVQVRLTRTQDVRLDTREDLSIAGEVWLCDALGQELKILNYLGNGDYVMEEGLETGKGYRLKATATGFDEVLSDAVYIPIACVPNSFEQLGKGVDPWTREPVHFLNINFVDDPGTENYYFCLCFELVNGRVGRPLDISANLSQGVLEVCDYGDIFPDFCFSGQAYTYPGMIGPRGGLLPDSVIVEFGAVDAGFYEYDRSQLLQPEGPLLLFEQPFPILSNVSGGYGMVVAKHTYFYEFGN